MNCESVRGLFNQPRRSRDELLQLAGHVTSCDECRRSLEEAAEMVVHSNKQAEALVLARLRRIGYVDSDIRVERAAGECRGSVVGLPKQDSYTPLGYGIGDGREDCMWASGLSEQGDIYTNEEGRWLVVFNRNEISGVWCENAVVLVRDREDISLVASEEPLPFTCTTDQGRTLSVALTLAEVVFCEMKWNRAQRDGMDEVRGVSTFDDFVREALLNALDLNGLSFKLRPLPQGEPDTELVIVPIVIAGDDAFAHLQRLYQQLLSHLFPGERALLIDPRVFARTLFMEGLRNMLD